MMNTESIQAEEEALKQQLEALEAKKREIAEKAEEAKQKAIEEQRKNGRANAIKALLALDEGGLIVQEDDRLYVVSGEVREELIVEEEFKRVGYGFRKFNGESKGFWFKLEQRRFTGEWKTGRWKKPESAYIAIKEMLEAHKAKVEREGNRKQWTAIAMERLTKQYPNVNIEEYGDGIRIRNKVGEVRLGVLTDGETCVRKAEAVDHRLVAALILGEPANA